MKTEKRIIEQLLLISICLFLSFIFISLRRYNQINFTQIIKAAPSILFPIIVAASLFYIAITIVLQTSLRKTLREILKVFNCQSHLHISYYICGVIVFYFLYSLMLKTPNDYPPHTSLAVDVFDWRSLKTTLLSFPYPLWHISVNILNKVLFVPPTYAAALVSAGFYTFEYTIIAKIMVSLNKNTNKYCFIFSMLLMLVQPIYIPWFNTNQYIGQGTPNVWHNPTIVCCYPFALITTFLFINMLQNHEKQKEIYLIDWFRLGFYLFLSTLAKPVFIQVFIPASAVYLLILLTKTKYRSFIFSLKFVLSCIPAGIWCIFILFLGIIFPSTTSYGSGGGIGIGFLEVWSYYTSNVFISIIIGITFPLVYILLTWKTVINNKKLITFILINYIAAILQFIIFKETGPRMYHGNFGWGNNISLTLLFVYVGADYFSLLSDKKHHNKPYIIFPTIILTLNILFGLHYYFEIFNQHITL